MVDYGINFWGNNDFIISEGKVKVNYKHRPALIDIVQDARERGYKGPLLLRFPHLIKNQVDKVFKAFEGAIKEYSYKGKFKAVFPLKVNQMPNFVLPLVEQSQDKCYGLEAGSKSELILAMAYTNKNSPITVNGFKDKEMISLGFSAANMGHDITLTIEGLNELETIIEVAHELGEPYPNIGLRIRLHSTGVGIWAKSGGINSKFGLTSTELLEAIKMLEKEQLLHKFTMIHFHIGSQISDISPLKKAIREAGNIYAELRKKGAKNLQCVNIGGGLAVEYTQHEGKNNRNYTLSEFSGDVVFSLREIAKNKKEPEPDIFIESGRFIAASHAVLVAPVLELFSQEYDEKALRLKKSNPPLIEELFDLYNSVVEKNAIEYLHDSLDHMESLLTLFDLGYIDLQDRSNTEVLVHLIIKKVIKLLKHKNYNEILQIQEQVQERYLLNCSFFQSLPDYWGLAQNFPVMPLDRLNRRPNRSASLWDITCDSDGEIAFNASSPLFLHDVDVTKEEYFLGFFLVGAYQEVLGMRHNLFTHPTEFSVEFDDDLNKGYELENLIEAQTILDVLDDLDYDTKDIERRLKQHIEENQNLDSEGKKEMLGRLYVMLSENGYLRTITTKKQ
ncbi:arginine decarboxylase [Helicobacter cinaedi PAGU611]|uniref:Arginine decarboxylase n=1 Tax=Helicobacter cinaedi CCUG 18818 = ATCC BAA-847 TaxID=537971 RepID=A0AAI8QI58_9HELI|nr:biosynthetic arginine decarboxylase [Helicobacter cinaedi]AWK62557.1 biosynthetic arginine decarboxylase [Helicobacter cinaedi]EFR46119.1 arginine 2-monooxygenase [Helicobacter cinaedi CCUG 18818 = ATCC BAA-847]QOQ90641.1 biosynthetic arginine decarboxylase [Helicobacter cinaedi]QOQ96807.1 biosynthetic arginine decarboxylase [Helicobacter cinaedi]BAM13157.1 arginine decarboxylase [Helicobacter cinaedi PAGU611]